MLNNVTVEVKGRQFKVYGVFSICVHAYEVGIYPTNAPPQGTNKLYLRLLPSSKSKSEEIKIFGIGIHHRALGLIAINSATNLQVNIYFDGRKSFF